MSVQLSQEGMPVLYRPLNLSDLTNGTGNVVDHTLVALQKLNAGYYFNPPNYPYRTAPVRIPTLSEALKAIPSTIPIILDLKAAIPAQVLVDAVVEVIKAEEAIARVYIYSTQNEHFDALQRYPDIRRFESRDNTRTHLIQWLFTCSQNNVLPNDGAWLGIELNRTLTVSENFLLGKGESLFPSVRLWNLEVISWIKVNRPNVQIFIFGIETYEDYQEAKRIGADAIMTDSPSEAKKWHLRSDQPEERQGKHTFSP